MPFPVHSFPGSSKQSLNGDENPDTLLLISKCRTSTWNRRAGRGGGGVYQEKIKYELQRKRSEGRPGRRGEDVEETGRPFPSKKFVMNISRVMNKVSTMALCLCALPLPDDLQKLFHRKMFM